MNLNGKSYDSDGCDVDNNYVRTIMALTVATITQDVVNAMAVPMRWF